MVIDWNLVKRLIVQAQVHLFGFFTRLVSFIILVIQLSFIGIWTIMKVFRESLDLASWAEFQNDIISAITS